LKDLKAKNYLFQALDRSILETIITKIHQRVFGTPWSKNWRNNPSKICSSPSFV